MIGFFSFLFVILVIALLVCWVIEKVIHLLYLHNDIKNEQLQNELLKSEIALKEEAAAMCKVKIWSELRGSRGKRSYVTNDELYNMGLSKYIG
ncbi:MAG: hypothetical protein GY841_15605 [FCB group bacterium]|nr:hypothetical protein [FCB group bacterium]